LYIVGFNAMFQVLLCWGSVIMLEQFDTCNEIKMFALCTQPAQN